MLRTATTPITRASLVLLLVGCHLGRPSAELGFELGRVEAPVAEPGVGDALRSGITAELARRGALGGSGGHEQVEARVLVAESATAGVTGDGRQVHRARLVVEVQRLGARPATLQLESTRAYEVDLSDPLGASAARAIAFEELGLELSRDAVLWLLHAPGGGP